MALWLASHEYPAIPALSVDQPVEADGRVATSWESVSEREEYASIEQVANLIRRMLDLAPPRTFTLPQFRPFDSARVRLDRATGLPEEDIEFMTARLGELQREYDVLDSALPIGLIHGDANVGNVILDRDGNPVLSDSKASGDDRTVSKAHKRVEAMRTVKVGGTWRRSSRRSASRAWFRGHVQ